MSVDGYTAICHPFQYKVIMSLSVCLFPVGIGAAYGLWAACARLSLLCTCTTVALIKLTTTLWLHHGLQCHSPLLSLSVPVPLPSHKNSLSTEADQDLLDKFEKCQKLKKKKLSNEIFIKTFKSFVIRVVLGICLWRWACSEKTWKVLSSHLGLILRPWTIMK